MKTIGVTGGIGSGKSSVVKMFSELGIPVYIADVRAKKLMNASNELKEKIIKGLGNQSYINGQLNRKFVAKLIFNDTEKLKQLNAIVHPAVHDDFKKWKKQLEDKNYNYCIYEAAILYESNRQHICDYTILVTAPKEIRINRVINRDKINKNEVLERMKHQWSDERKQKLADYIIHNIDYKSTRESVNKIHNLLQNS